VGARRRARRAGADAARGRRTRARAGRGVRKKARGLRAAARRARDDATPGLGAHTDVRNERSEWERRPWEVGAAKPKRAARRPLGSGPP